ncbi:PLP-dependent aminotransferase family protein [Leptospira sp. 96542]|nr:PLP-dependent aminotransferase family protein [Leptospira sp. 96542]
MDETLTTQFLADRQKSFRPSLIRDILKASIQNINLLSFAGGLPDPEVLFDSNFLSTIEGTVSKYYKSALQYGDSSGLFSLREWIFNEFYNKNGEDVNLDSIFITSGSQQGLDLIGKIFLDKNSKLLLEAPSYLGAIQAFSAYEPQVASIGIGTDGPDPMEMEKIIQKEKIQFFYTNPNFQNPSTVHWSVDKRKLIAGILDYYNVLLFEDEAYKLLDFSGEIPPSISSFRKKKDQCFYLGSFSKIMSPGFRLGWVSVPKEFQKSFLMAKQTSDLNSNQFSQVILSEFLHANDLYKFLPKLTTLYERRKNCLVEELKLQIPQANFSVPKGGMFLWVSFEGLNAQELFEKAMQYGVCLVPGSEFFWDYKKVNQFRMNFTYLGEADTKEGVKRLKMAIVCLPDKN